MDALNGVPAGFGIGIVKFFDNREGKKYGFLRVCDDDGRETGEEIFFHYNDGADISDSRGRTPLAIPRSGDRIGFFVMSGKEGKPKACPWEYDLPLPIGAAMDEPDWDLDEEEFDATYHGPDDEEELVSMSTVRQRASRHFGGNTELAREAAEMYPGDFIT